MEKKIVTLFKRHYCLLLVILLTLFALLPLTRSGFWPMHDDEQVGRLYQMDLAVRNGHIPPRIAPDLGFGYGYPLFNYYPAFVYYIAEIFVLVGFSYISSIELMIALGFFVTAIFMYLFAKEYLGEVGGLVAAVAYTYAPYHAVDVYVRGALPEFWAFAFIPALFWSCKKLADTVQRRYVILTALFTAGLILTHNLVAFMSGMFLSIYVIFLLTQTKKRKTFFLTLLLCGVLGLLLSAFFWIPSYFEKQYTMIELLTKELADYNQHFVYLRQLWNSPWGYGGSLFGLVDGLSFQIGKIHILFSFVALALGVYFLRKKNPVSHVIFLFFGFFVLAVFLLSFYSKPLWDSIQPLSYIQFPWRFLLFASFSGSFLLGVIGVAPVSKLQKYVISGVLVLVIIIMNISFFQPFRYLPDVTDRDYTSPEVIRWRTSVMAFEYVPRGIATKKSDIGTTVVDIAREQIASKAATVTSGTMDVKVVTDIPQEKIITVSASSTGVLTFNTFSFPGWKVYLDGKETTYTDANKLKLITVSIPVGEHTVRAVFTDTPLRFMSNMLSLLGVSLLILLYIPDMRRFMKTR